MYPYNNRWFLLSYKQGLGQYKFLFYLFLFLKNMDQRSWLGGYLGRLLICGAHGWKTSKTHLLSSGIWLCNQSLGIFSLKEMHASSNLLVVQLFSLLLKLNICFFSGYLQPLIRRRQNWRSLWRRSSVALRFSPLRTRLRAFPLRAYRTLAQFSFC